MVEYVDGHRDIVYDFESLKNYHSNRQIMSSGFDLSFSYLVDFANQSKPEKQDIRVRVRSSFPSKSAIRKEQSSIYTAISFSNLTWGEDLSRHIASHVASIVRTGWFIKILRLVDDHSKIFSAFLALLAMTLFFHTISSSSDQVAARLGIDSILKAPNNNIHDLGNKLDILLSYETDRFRTPSFVTWSPLLIILPMFVPDIVSKLVDMTQLSYVSLNTFTLDRASKDLDKNTRIKWILIGACVTIPVGLLIAYLRSL